ncbi:MAG: 16S rRNA (guanine(527)-N(7))-methyltransferase RsmG [Treponema sp.]|nr:16S rRNA (guanine(527)-N(7))-methyltransferase RsmG [Treponema sp.]
MVSTDQLLERGLAALCEGHPAVAQLLSNRGEALAGLLNTYRGEIELFNPAYSLVGAKDPQELVVKHLLDSLAPLGSMIRLLGAEDQESRGLPSIADVGSGAGLPGIPLALCLPQFPVTLIERSGRRVQFLSNTLAVLGLSQVTVEAQEMEKAAPGRFALVTFRAFRPLEPELLKGLFRLLKPGGVLAAYKGRKETINAEMGAIQHLTGGWEAIPTPVPFLEEERHLVVIRRRNE